MSQYFTRIILQYITSLGYLNYVMKCSDIILQIYTQDATDTETLSCNYIILIYKFIYTETLYIYSALICSTSFSNRVCKEIYFGAKHMKARKRERERERERHALTVLSSSSFDKSALWAQRGNKRRKWVDVK